MLADCNKSHCDIFLAAPADYTQVTSTPITIPSGTTEVTLTYSIEDDDIFERDEEFELMLMVDMATMSEGILTGSPDVAIVTILDNDGRFEVTWILIFTSVNEFAPTKHLLVGTLTERVAQPS